MSGRCAYVTHDGPREVPCGLRREAGIHAGYDPRTCLHNPRHNCHPFKEEPMPEPPRLVRVKVVQNADINLEPTGRHARRVVLEVSPTEPFPPLGSEMVLAPRMADVTGFLADRSQARQRVITAAEEWYDRMEGVYGGTIQETVAGTWTEELFDAVRSMRAKGEGSDAW